VEKQHSNFIREAMESFFGAEFAISAAEKQTEEKREDRERKRAENRLILPSLRGSMSGPERRRFYEKG